MNYLGVKVVGFGRDKKDNFSFTHVAPQLSLKVVAYDICPYDFWFLDFITVQYSVLKRCTKRHLMSCNFEERSEKDSIVDILGLLFPPHTVYVFSFTD